MGVTYTTTYQYDAEHRAIGMTLPSGRTVTYQRDGLRRISGIDAEISGINTNLVSGISYRSDGVVTARQYGNGIAETRVYDQQRRLAQQTIGTADSILLSYDANSNVLSRDTQTDTHSYGYDVLHRLEAETNDGATIDYTYDPDHNRLTKDDGVQVTQYTYGAGGNQLVGIDATVLSYDLAGNLTDNGRGQTYIYNDANRLVQMFDTTLIATYVYNRLGQRIHKTTVANTTVYHYDLAGRLIGETADDGTPLKDYVWQDGSPIAQIDGATVADTVTYLHTDHLATPRLGTDLVGNVVWQWEGVVFGETQPIENPTTVNLRFPGQYADAESGLLYNWNRYYDPKTGRYLTTDPIELNNSPNVISDPRTQPLYAYAANNPLRFTDPNGLTIIFGGSWTAIGRGGGLRYIGRQGARLQRYVRPRPGQCVRNRPQFPEQQTGSKNSLPKLVPPPSSRAKSWYYFVKLLNRVTGGDVVPFDLFDPTIIPPLQTPPPECGCGDVPPFRFPDDYVCDPATGICRPGA